MKVLIKTFTFIFSCTRVYHFHSSRRNFKKRQFGRNCLAIIYIVSRVSAVVTLSFTALGVYLLPTRPNGRPHGSTRNKNQLAELRVI